MLPSEAAVTVRDIIHLALPLGTTVISGAGALERHVEWVTSLRAAFPLFGSLSSGYLAIARLSLARGLDTRLTPAYLITELHRVGAAALVVDEPISEQEAQLADVYSLPVICLPPNSDLFEIERSALRTVIDREGQIARRESEIKQHLLAAFERGGIGAVLNEAAATCGGKWELCTPNHVCIASAGSSQQAGKVYPVTVGGRTHGQLIVYSERPSDDLTEQITIRQTLDVCGIALVELTARREAEEHFGTALIEQLLSSEDSASIQSRLARLGLSAAERTKNVAIVLGAADDQSLTHIEEAAYNLVKNARHGGYQAASVPYRKQIIVLLSAESQPSDRLFRLWCQQAFETAGDASRIGVGRFLDGIDGVKLSTHQAIDAWDLGQHLATSGGLFYYEELGLYRLLARLRGNEEMKRFYQDTLGPLEDYDKRHNAELVHTLAVFFEQNANASQAARILYIHRNTLNYRLQRITEITGLSLEDPEARIAFQVALKINQITT